MNPTDISLRLLQFLGLIIPLTLLSLEHTDEYTGTHTFSKWSSIVFRKVLRRNVEVVSTEVLTVASIVSLSVSALSHLLAVFLSLANYGNSVIWSAVGVVFSFIGILILCLSFYSILRHDLATYSRP